MHIHIHALVHYARLLGSMRFLGTMLLMLLFNLLQLDSAKPASAMPTTKDNHHTTIDCFYHGSTVSIRGESDPATDPGYRREDRMGSAFPDAINTNAHSSVFYRLMPGIVMIPRMNRTPKPKSVYRLFARAPGEGISSSLLRCMDCIVMCTT